MGLVVGGVALDGLLWNVRTRAGRMATAGRVGSNVPRAGLDGALWRPKPLGELVVDIEAWLVGSTADGEFSGSQRARMRQRYDRLLAVFGAQTGLVEIVSTDSGRRCFAEVQGVVAPSLMAGGTRAEVLIPVVIPAGFWEDVAVVSTAPVVLPAAGPVTLTSMGGGNLPLSGLTVRLKPPGRNVRVTASDGSWVQFSGDLPAGDDTLMVFGPGRPSVKQEGSSVSLLSALSFDGPTAQPLQVPVPLAGDPVVQVTSEAASTASRISFSGRRRWQSA